MRLAPPTFTERHVVVAAILTLLAVIVAASGVGLIVGALGLYLLALVEAAVAATA